MKRLVLVCIAVLLGVGLLNPSAHALNFAVYALDELLEQADAVVIGTITDKSDKTNDQYSQYTVSVEQSIAGDLQVGSDAQILVLNWSDEGILLEGETYLLLLMKQNDNQTQYGIAGVHQGFIQLMSDGEVGSRFYGKEEVAAYLEAQGIAPSEWLAKAAADPTGSSSGEAQAGGTAGPTKGQSSGFFQLTVVIVALALVGLLVWSVRRRQ